MPPDGPPMEEPSVWRAGFARLQRLLRRPEAGLIVALASGGSALVAATWLVAQLSVQGQLRAMEAELTFLRRTRQVDLPRLLGDLERLAGPAADRLALQELRQRHASLERDHKATLAVLADLRRRRRLEERFSLSVGGTRRVLAGKVTLALEGMEGGGASISLAGAPASLWRPGDFRDLNFGGGRFRLTLDTLASEPAPEASFRLDALLDSGAAEPPLPSPVPGPP